MIYEANQPSFQAGRLVVIYHDFINPRSAKTASTNRITRAAARWDRRNRKKLTISTLPGTEFHQEGVGSETFGLQRLLGSLCIALMFAR